MLSTFTLLTRTISKIAMKFGFDSNPSVELPATKLVSIENLPNQSQTSSPTAQKHHQNESTHRKNRDFRNTQKNVRKGEPETTQVPFGKLSVSSSIRRALIDMGYETPTPIQEQVIPLALRGNDVVGQAQTGTGKTAAFGIPIAEMINQNSKQPQALVLTPTRELALQVTKEISRIGSYNRLKSIAIYGGQPLQTQIEILRKGVHLIIGTPGRLIDHINRRTISLDNIRIAVLDEADKMLDIGFIQDIEHILRNTPRKRQTLLFSATIPSPIRRLTRRFLNNPHWIRIGGESEPAERIEQFYYEVAADDRLTAISEILDHNVTQALIFRKMKAGVDYLVSELKYLGHQAQGIHSGMSQSQRERVMESFKSRRLKLLVATNLASRGLDIPAVSHVINYDMPDNLEEYIHRIGRTARMGREGIAISFVSDIQDFELLDKLQEHLGNSLKQSHLNLLYNQRK